MAQILSQTLIRAPQAVTLIKSPTFLLSSRRSKSDRPPPPPELIEIDLGPESEPGGTELEVEIHVGLRRLEDAIHGIVVRRSRPDWLPFVPGSSYWVPPMGRRAMGVIQLVGRMPMPSFGPPPLSEDETMSLTSFRGWPSSAYFLDGGDLPHPLPRSVKRKSSRKVKAQSDDEE
ncbi:uncharacterized protein M6B38_346845 [Iris pallida]|uniref:Uncharacterized protein n=1 Tax=Iris pallida TaxID=29817 RepID=A0AAX6GU43_IRIPA|nr:uncharacterized protein M6B38_346845 [Iris pallida]